MELKAHQRGHKWKPPTEGAVSHCVVSRWICTVYLWAAFLSHSLNTLNLWAAADMHKSHYKWIMHRQCRQRRSRPRKQPVHPINICPPRLPVSRARWEGKNRADNLCVPALISSHTTAGPNVGRSNVDHHLLGWVTPLYFTLITHWECNCAKCQTTLLCKSRHYFTALDAILNVLMKPFFCPFG